MKIFVATLFVALVASAAASPADSQKDYCDKTDLEKNQTSPECGSGSCFRVVNNFKIGDESKIDKSCNAKLSHFKQAGTNLAQFANRHFEISYKYMLLAAQFDSYTKDRPGFYSHFMALSDRSWEAGMGLIKYITKRGAQHTFAVNHQLKDGIVDVTEFQSMALALDNEKFLFADARKIHEDASHAHKTEYYDPEAAHYVEEEHLEALAGTVRKYAGFANDLKNLGVKTNDENMDHYLFDQYLQKAL